MASCFLEITVESIFCGSARQQHELHQPVDARNNLNLRRETTSLNCD
jgi:hypothetical protein